MIGPLGRLIRAPAATLELYATYPASTKTQPEAIVNTAAATRSEATFMGTPSAIRPDRSTLPRGDPNSAACAQTSEPLSPARCGESIEFGARVDVEAGGSASHLRRPRDHQRLGRPARRGARGSDRSTT